MYQQFLNLMTTDNVSSEVFNGARTLAYLKQAGNGFPSVRISDPSCCSTINLSPCDNVPLVFTHPDDPYHPAPWWDGVTGSPSAGGLGFWITAWTGLDGAQNQRSVAPRGLRPGGATFGPMGASHRVWKMNVRMFGKDECALEEMFRWLEGTFLTSCDSCYPFGALIRTCCPPVTDPNFGLYRVEGVALLDGPSYEGSPTAGHGCFTRDISFTLGVANPCMFSPPVNCITDGSFPPITGCPDFDILFGTNCTSGPVNPTIIPANRICCPVPTSANYGSWSPYVEITNTGGAYSTALTVYGLDDPIGLACDPSTQLHISELHLKRLPPGAQLIIDSSRRTMLFRAHITDSSFVDGSPWIDLTYTSSSIYSDFGCAGGWVAIEAKSLLDANCSTVTFSVDFERRVGCL